MGIIAVAGGTGHMGRTIVEALIASGKHKTIILSRKPNPDLTREIGVPILAADYSDIPSVTKILEDNSVDTVISALSMMPHGPGMEPKEVELIRAADASKTTKRMLSSDWGNPHRSGDEEVLGSVIWKRRAQEELKAVKNLETTRILNGCFMDYWGIPGVKSHLNQMAIVVDIPNNMAAIPGDGQAPVIMTHTTDIAKFVVASLDLDKWDPVHYVFGDKPTMSQLLRYAEEAKGERFTVAHDSLDDLRAGVISELPGHVAAYQYFPKNHFTKMLAGMELWFAGGVFNYEMPTCLNDKFPEIKPLTTRELIDRAWKKS